MKKLASDLTLPSDLFMIILVSSLSFMLGGFICGLALIATQWPYPWLLEGATGGLLLGIYLRRRYPIWQPIVAGMAGIAVGILAQTIVGMTVKVPGMVGALVGGIIAGAIFGAILNARRAILVFVLVGAAGFSIGQFLLEYFDQLFPEFYQWISLQSGNYGVSVVQAGLMGLYHGITLGVAIVLTVWLHRRQLTAA
jgi:hypothetical protein